ncbi:MAG: prepilin-type N-terminal cleavage/methylation domain-containing protein [bacterium]
MGIPELGCDMIRFLQEHTRKGFTLIELLIVVAIIGILAAIAVPNFMNARIRASVAKVEADMRTLATALESYRLDNNGYPPYPLWGGHSDQRYLNALSTPVAYLTSPESVDDPFGLLEDHDGETGKRFGYNIITDRIFLTYEGDQGIWKGVRLPGSFVWMLRSRGPDKNMNFSPDDASANPRGVFLMYQPSNGVISSGDIFGFGP